MKNLIIPIAILVFLPSFAFCETLSAIGILSPGNFKLTFNGLLEITTSGPGAFGGLFFVAWLSAWTVGGAFAIYAWLWQLKGFERISLLFEAFVLKRIIPIWKRKKEYRLRDVASLRLSNSSSSMWTMSGSMDFWGISGGRLAFDYGAKTVQFGTGRDDAEAKLLIKDIEKKNPRIIEKII